MPVDRFEPARGTGEEIERGHEHQRKAVVQAPHPCSDQPHVVVEREPAHEHVARRRPERHGHGLQRGDHVAVAEHHPLGAAGAAGGVLEEGGRGFVEGRALPKPAVPIEPGHVDHRIEPRDLRGQQLRDPEGGGEGHEGAGPRVREDPRVAPHVVFELAQPRGRVDRHRDRPGDLHREEGREVVEAGGQHQRRGLARRKPPVGEAGRDVLGAIHQRREGDPRRLALRSVELDVDAPAVAAGVEIDRFEQRPGAGGDRVRRFRPRFVIADRRRHPPAPAAGQERRQQLPRRLRVGHDGFGDRDSERAFEPREQLHAREAVEPEIAVERAVEGDVGARAEMGVELGDDLSHRRDERLRVGGLRLGRCFLRAVGHGARDRRDSARVRDGDVMIPHRPFPAVARFVVLRLLLLPRARSIRPVG